MRQAHEKCLLPPSLQFALGGASRARLEPATPMCSSLIFNTQIFNFDLLGINYALNSPFPSFSRTRAFDCRSTSVGPVPLRFMNCTFLRNSRPAIPMVSRCRRSSSLSFDLNGCLSVARHLRRWPVFLLNRFPLSVLIRRSRFGFGFIG